MTALTGGLAALALGLIGLGIWWNYQFLNLLAGSIPLLLLLGGALAVYLGYEEAKDKFFKKSDAPATEASGPSDSEVERYKVEVDRLKSEIAESEKIIFIILPVFKRPPALTGRGPDVFPRKLFSPLLPLIFLPVRRHPEPRPQPNRIFLHPRALRSPVFQSNRRLAPFVKNSREFLA